jgi:hypothetical protein
MLRKVLSEVDAVRQEDQRREQAQTTNDGKELERFSFGVLRSRDVRNSLN